MSVAIRAITRLQDADDVNISLGAGVDEYALCWDNDTAKFVLRAMSAGVTDHGALTGLTPDDDHTQYALLAGRAGGQTLYGGNAANDDITIHGTSNATRDTSYVLLQPSGGNVGIGTSAPAAKLHVVGTSGADGLKVYASDPAWSAQYVSVNTYGSLTSWQTSNAANTAYGVALIGDAYGRVAFGTDTGVPFFGVGPGNTGRDAFLSRSAANTLHLSSDLSSGKAHLIVNGNVGIGTTSPGSLLHGLLTSAATNAVTNVLTIGHDTSGTAANGFGAGQLFTLESSTTAAQDAARIQALWYEATHATRKADLVLTAYDTAEREGLRIRGAGSAPAIGFLGAAPAARVAHVADPSGGATVDAEARSAINSILATLEIFGFHATS